GERTALRRDPARLLSGHVPLGWGTPDGSPGSSRQITPKGTKPAKTRVRPNPRPPPGSSSFQAQEADPAASRSSQPKLGGRPEKSTTCRQAANFGAPRDPFCQRQIGDATFGLKDSD